MISTSPRPPSRTTLPSENAGHVGRASNQRSSKGRRCVPEPGHISTREGPGGELSFPRCNINLLQGKEINNPLQLLGCSYENTIPACVRLRARATVQGRRQRRQQQSSGGPPPATDAVEQGRTTARTPLPEHDRTLWPCVYGSESSCRNPRHVA